MYWKLLNTLPESSWASWVSPSSVTSSSFTKFEGNSPNLLFRVPFHLFININNTSHFQLQFIISLWNVLKENFTRTLLSLPNVFSLWIWLNSSSCASIGAYSLYKTCYIPMPFPFDGKTVIHGFCLCQNYEETFFFSHLVLLLAILPPVGFSHSWSFPWLK